MVQAQANIMCQDTGNSSVLRVCHQPAVAEIKVKLRPDSMGENKYVCQRHFIHPSYPIVAVISSSVTFEKKNKPSRDIVNRYPIGDEWFMNMTIRGARDLPPGTWPMHLVSRRVDTESFDIYEIYSIKDQGDGQD